MSVRNWPTWKIKEVLDSPILGGVDGKDYGPIEQELRDEYFRRFDKIQREQEKQDDKDWQAFEDYSNKRKEVLKEIIRGLKLEGGLTYSLALDLKRELEFLTEYEVCPFVWAVFENNYKPEMKQ